MTDGALVYNKRGFHIPIGLDGKYYIVADNGKAEYVTKDFALSGGERGNKDGRSKASSKPRKKGKKAS